MTNSRNHAVIKAEYADYRPVKGRKVLQIICEVPREQAPDVHRILGEPGIHDKQIWVAIALLNEETGQAKEAPKKKRDRKLSELCAMRCKEPEFQQWVLAGKWLPGHAQTWTREEQTKFVVKRACGINTDYGSRAALDINPEAAERWKNLEASYLYHNTPAMERGK